LKLKSHITQESLKRVVQQKGVGSRSVYFKFATKKKLTKAYICFALYIMCFVQQTNFYIDKNFFKSEISDIESER